MGYLKQLIQDRSLKTAISNNHRNKSMANFDAVQTIGILSNPGNINEIKEIDKVIRYFRDLKKQMFPLIYFDKTLENEAIAYNKDLIRLGKKNCNWIGKPRLELKLNGFIEKEFDILIDLSYSKNYSLQYVFVQSKAKLKIMSTSDQSKDFADLMLETSNPKNKLVFIKELIRYLEIINKVSQ